MSELAMYARDAGVDWQLASTLNDDKLQARLYPPPRPRSSTRVEPEYAALRQKLKHPGVTLQLLWEEYSAGASGAAYRDKSRSSRMSKAGAFGRAATACTA